MNAIKKRSLLSLSIICFSALTACGNSNAGNNQANSSAEVKQSTQSEQQTDVTQVNSEIQAELDKAQKAGKAVFVVVTGTGSTDTDKAKEIAKGANSIYKNAIVIEMNRDDSANAKLVAEWRLSGAPLPLILVVSPKGMLTEGRILAQATAENVAALVPSPKKEEVLNYISSGKSVFLIVSNNKMADKKSPLGACEKACFELQEKAKIVSVNTDDSSELAFLKELRIDPNITQPMTYVINAQGQVTGTYNGEVNSTALVASAKKIISSSCCAPGSGQSCEPAK